MPATNKKEDVIMDVTWKDIRGLFLHLAPEKQERFIDYLRSLQDNEESPTPGSFEIQKVFQNIV